MQSTDHLFRDHKSKLSTRRSKRNVKKKKQNNMSTGNVNITCLEKCAMRFSKEIHCVQS